MSGTCRCAVNEKSEKLREGGRCTERLSDDAIAAALSSPVQPPVQLGRTVDSGTQLSKSAAMEVHELTVQSKLPLNSKLTYRLIQSQ
jgi:hypothetical protein